MGAGTSNSDRSSEAIVADTEQDAAELLTKIGRYYQAMYNLGDIRSPGPDLRAACAKLLTVAEWLDTARDEQLQEQAAPAPAPAPRQPASLPQAVAELLAENPGQTWTPAAVATTLQERGLAVGASYRHHVKVALGRMAQRNDSNIHKLDRGKYLYSPAGETTMR